MPPGHHHQAPSWHMCRQRLRRRGFHLSKSTISSMLVTKGASWLRTPRMTPVALPASILPHLESAISAFNASAPESSHIHAYTTEALRCALQHESPHDLTCQHSTPRPGSKPYVSTGRLYFTSPLPANRCRPDAGYTQEDCICGEHPECVAGIHSAPCARCDRPHHPPPSRGLHPASMAVYAVPCAPAQPRSSPAADAQHVGCDRRAESLPHAAQRPHAGTLPAAPQPLPAAAPPQVGIPADHWRCFSLPYIALLNMSLASRAGTPSRNRSKWCCGQMRRTASLTPWLWDGYMHLNVTCADT